MHSCLFLNVSYFEVTQPSSQRRIGPVPRLSLFLDPQKRTFIGKGTKLLLQKRLQKNFCPAAQLFLYIRRLNITSPEAPLFLRLLCWTTGFRCADRGLSYQLAYEQLVRLLRHLHIADKLGFHSLVVLLQEFISGFSSDNVKRHGRWRRTKL